MRITFLPIDGANEVCGGGGEGEREWWESGEEGWKTATRKTGNN